MSIFEELKRRNVIRVGIAYLVGSWLLLQIIDVVGPILHLPDELARYLLFLLVVGLIPALIVAWAFELTPDGVRLESEVDRSKSVTTRTGRKLDRIIMVVLALAVGFLLFDKLALDDTVSTGTSVRTAGTTASPSMPATNAEQKLRKSVAVLPFATMSNGPDDDYFSDGLTEEIINSLAQLPELLVTARTSAFHFKDQNVPIKTIAGQLGVDNVVEGSVRRAGEQLRITAQLIRAEDGFHLWSETYDRRTEDTFAVQEDIAEKIALALDVVLNDVLLERMRRVGVRNVEAFTEYQKGRELFTRAHNDVNLISLLRQGNAYFEDAVRLAPGFPDAYLIMSDLDTHILMSQANGELDGEITAEDIRTAPANLRRKYDLAIQYATNKGQKLSAIHDRAVIMGEWNGLSARVDRTLAVRGCETPYWIQLTSSAFGKAKAAFDGFARTAVCDPLFVRPMLHMINAGLWQGDVAQTLSTAQRAMKSVESEWLTRSYALALAQAGRTDQAKKVAKTQMRTEREKLIAQLMIAATEGDAAKARGHKNAFLTTHGPNDFVALMMAAMTGNRNEANRLASVIDSRPFGYMSLLQSIYWCTCGAPFDLEAAPQFAARLSGSGLPWPPENPLNFPLKEW